MKHRQQPEKKASRQGFASHTRRSLVHHYLPWRVPKLDCIASSHYATSGTTKIWRIHDESEVDIFNILAPALEPHCHRLVGKFLLPCSATISEGRRSRSDSGRTGCSSQCLRGIRLGICRCASSFCRLQRDAESQANGKCPVEMTSAARLARGGAGLICTDVYGEWNCLNVLA